MTRQQFEVMMMQYGISMWSDAAYRIAKMAAEWERTECEKACDKLLQDAYQANQRKFSEHGVGVQDGMVDCLEAIRARGQA